MIAFTTPLGNQPPLEIISSLLKNGAPGGVIDIQHTTGTRERLECNGAGFCDKAGNITIEFEATAPVLTQRGFLPFPNSKLRRRRDAVDTGVRAAAQIVGVVATVSIHAGADERHLRLRRGLRVGPGLRQLRPAAVQHERLDGAAALSRLRFEGHGSGPRGCLEPALCLRRGRVELHGGRDLGGETTSRREHFIVISTWRDVHERCALGVPRCRGAFTPSTRLVSIRRGRGWSLFRF